RGFLYRMAARRLLRENYRTAFYPGEFEHVLDAGITGVQQHCSARIICLTMGCINEYIPNELNGKRAAFNEVIRDVAWNHGCRVADVAEQFEKYLMKHPGKDYLLNNFFNTVWFDR